MPRARWTREEMLEALGEAEARLAVSPRARLTLRQAAALEGCHPETLARRVRRQALRAAGGGGRGVPLSFSPADLIRATDPRSGG